MSGGTNSRIDRVAVVGAGAWGTALAVVCARAGRTVSLWAREPDVAASVNRSHANPRFLPGIDLDPAIRASSDLADAVAGAHAVLLAVPAQFVRGVAAQLAGRLGPGAPIAICAKGIEVATGKLMTEATAEACPGHPLAVLSGPTFAAEVASGLPTAITLASCEREVGQRLVDALGTRTFRPYLGDDPVGTQVGGAVKNVIAIGCGIVDGRRLGENARAALLTRGLAEIMRLGVALGAKRETLMGLSGLGDLVLTCASRQSRNNSLGVALGRGASLAEALAGRVDVVEGVASAEAVAALAARRGVDMPIVAAIDAVLHRGADIGDAVEGLLARPFKPEEER